MAASLLRIGRLGCVKCLQAGSWSTLSKAPVAVAFSTKSGSSKKLSQKNTVAKKQAKTYFDIEKLVQHKPYQVCPATAAEAATATASTTAAKPAVKPMPSAAPPESVATTSVVVTGRTVVKACPSAPAVPDTASAAEAKPIVDVPPAVESATTTGTVPVVEPPSEVATIFAAVAEAAPVVKAAMQASLAIPSDFAEVTVLATLTAAPIGKAPAEAANKASIEVAPETTDAEAAPAVEDFPKVVPVEDALVDVIPESVAETAPVIMAMEPVAKAAPIGISLEAVGEAVHIEVAPEPVAEAIPEEVATEPVAEASPVIVAMDPVAEAAPVIVAMDPVAEAASVDIAPEPVPKAVCIEEALQTAAEVVPVETALDAVSEEATVSVFEAAPVKAALDPVAKAAPKEAALDPLEAESAPTDGTAEAAAEVSVLVENAEELVDRAPVITEGAGQELQEEVPDEPSEAHMDPIQKLFLDSIRKYSSRSQATGGLVDPGSEYEEALAEELAKVQRLYGGGDLTSFPEFKFAEPKLDEVSQK